MISPHPSSTYPIAPGDIKVFKGMELTSLNLFYCEKLTGVFGLGWGMVGGVKIGNRLRPQDLITPLHPLSYPPLTFEAPALLEVELLDLHALEHLDVAWGGGEVEGRGGKK